MTDYIVAILALITAGIAFKTILDVVESFWEDEKNGD